MSKFSANIGATDVSILLFIRDTTVTDRVAGKTGVAFDDAGLSCHLVRTGAAPVPIPLVVQTVAGAHADGGLVEISAANTPGWYRFDPPDTVFVAGVVSSGLHFGVPAGIEIQPTEIELHSPIKTGADDGVLISSDTHISGQTVADMTPVLTAIAALENISISDVVASLELYDGPTNAELSTALGGLNDLSATDIFAHDVGNGLTLLTAILALASRIESTDNGDGTGTITVYNADKTTVAYIADTTLSSGGLLLSVVPR